ncbi:Methyl-accepting chemotaxis protein (plasmid) [Nostoc flagelliforme CCNUN1]|uniref:Methyl-accepting chemotaxis protein n=1 Tax=Nostoc flagelliforme CCNUN1 TaxID=2038116 RepID=A0A2K8T9Z7_9NOSO|nr:hypothetical protein [Nostoc flagelliforme]AUB44403.1 Methyl-accepting chemotaxis protein [Nostoc flagelliforme CCNUN1]
MTATITRPKLKKSAATSKQQSPYKRLHVIIPIEDMLWASQQKPSVTQLWQEGWTADPYGSRWMPLTSALGYSTFICAKKILSESGLFIFKPDKSIEDSRETVTWMVKNLHGSRMKEFWEKANSVSPKPDAEKPEPNAEISDKDAGSEEMGALNQASILGKNQSEQGLCETSGTAQEQFTNSSFEFVNCVSDTLTRISHQEETAIAPLKGASPQSVQGMSDIEVDLPTAMNCTTRPSSSPSELGGVKGKGEGVKGLNPKPSTLSPLPSPHLAFLGWQTTRVDVARGESANLEKENQDFGVEPKDSHIPSASGIGTDSTEIVPNLEKWSDEAIAARSNMRLQRMHQLQIAADSGQNPRFDFLLECWNDDPVLMLMIKKLLVKYPHWGIAIVDGVLVNWEG